MVRKCTGKARMKPINEMRSLGKWYHAEGLPRAVRWTLLLQQCFRAKLTQPRITNVPSLVGLEHRDEGVQQTAIPLP